MPLYDCMLLVKPLVPKGSIAELVGRVARRAYQRNGVITDLKSFSKVQLGYDIKKLDDRHYQVRTTRSSSHCSFSYSRRRRHGISTIWCGRLAIGSMVFVKMLVRTITLALMGM
jgi:ribosomal protein S6